MHVMRLLQLLLLPLQGRLAWLTICLARSRCV
jgi:hypothetical protein